AARIPPHPAPPCVPAAPPRAAGSGWGDGPPGPRLAPAAALRAGAEARTRRVHEECRECGRPPVAGDLCAECAGWPLCEGCGKKRVAPGGEGVCSLCATTAATCRTAEPAGVCPGHDGTGCGTPVREAGPLGLLCGRCEIKARRAKADADAEWEAVRAAAVSAATAADEAEATEAPGEPQLL
ncbi:hypothetical protein ACE14D_00200, partial [Streptomyces sp. Act-28]